MDPIKIIFLISGQEVIARVSRDEDQNMLIPEPFIIQAEMDPSNGQIKVGFASFMPFCHNQQFPLNQNLVITVGDPEPQMKENYERATSPIAQPAGTGELILPK